MTMTTPAHIRLRSLASATGVGLFRNFAWDAAKIDEFGRYNLVYGWNYSGKTTLSRLFQCLEDRALHSDFTGGAFQFTKGDGAVVDSTFATPPPHVRVFNRHFVQRNFHGSSDMTGAAVIAVLGEANQSLKSRAACLTARADRVAGIRARLQAARAVIQQSIDDDRTAQARVINAIVGGPYDRRHLNAAIDALPRDNWPLPFDQRGLEERKEQFRKATDFSQVPLYAPDHRTLVRICLAIRTSLREVATNTALEALRENSSLERWVQAGLSLNAAGAPCGFCGAQVSSARWTQLQGHFSEAFAALQAKLRDHRAVIQSLDFRAPTLAEASLFPDLRSRFRVAHGALLASLDTARQAAADIQASIEAKLSRLETATLWRPDVACAIALRSCMMDYNAILEEHNGRVAAAHTVKADARRAICEHFAVEYLRDSRVLEKQRTIQTLDARISACNAVSSNVQSRIASTMQAIKSASIAARRINENLAVLLAGDNIEAVKLNETDFQFQRGGRIASNMSEGERTAVAFSYFLTKLDEGTIPLRETVIVLDDPVSSLDSNHIYALHSIIETRLSQAGQLFVLTHNSSFFGITKDWMKKRDGRFYMTQRTMTPAREWQTSLVRLPRLLKKFKSDYQYTYYCLKVIDSDASPQFENLCGVPNMVRRLLESYLGFVFPECGGWGDKLQMIIPSTEICGKIKKFADENSHAHSLAQATEIPDYVSHCKEVVRDVLTALANHNPAHVASLEAEFATEASNLP